MEGFKGGKIAPLSSGGAGFQTPKLSEVLTEKEAKEYREKFSGVLLTIFRYVDMGITNTNRDRATAYIWQDIDDEDLGVLVQVLVEGAKKSRIVATAVKQVSKAHTLLKVGAITAPKFMATVDHYKSHGGFALNLFGQQFSLFGSSQQPTLEE